MKILNHIEYQPNDRVIVNLGSISNPDYYLGRVKRKEKIFYIISCDNGVEVKLKGTKTKAGLVGKCTMNHPKRTTPIHKTNLIHWLRG